VKEMKEEKFTEDNEFSELKNLLKSLPKVDAPDNFEFNLMTKIQNNNFEVKSEKKKNWFSWSLAPAITFATTVFVVLFFLSSGEESYNNPWETPPQLMEQNVADTQVPNSKTERVEERKGKIKREQKNTKNLAVRNGVQKDYPFNKEASINFDEYLRSKASKSGSNSTQLAGGVTSNAPSFDGFFLRQRKIAERKDSIRKEQDSLKQQNVINK
jgi:cytoskeletal protein RodZ